MVRLLWCVALLMLASAVAATAGGDSVSVERDIPYAGTTNPRQTLDLFLPTKRNTEKLPVVVFIHGGGWSRGDKSEGSAALQLLAATGDYAGVSVGYRLSGEAIWPAQIHDVKAALRWVRAAAPQHGLDPAHIGVWGPSAGGHLALVAGLTGGVKELEGDLGLHTGVDSRVACVVNYYGITDIPGLIGQPSSIDRTADDAIEAKLLGGPILQNTKRAKAASPVTYITPDDPPVLTIHGDKDLVVPFDQALRLDDALLMSGVKSTFVTVRGAGHGDFPPEAFRRVITFFERCLLEKDVPLSGDPITAAARE